MKVKLEIPEPDNRDHYAKHHVYYGNGNRNKSEKWGCVIYLPHALHNMSDAGIHFNKAFDNEVKIQYQTMLEAAGWTREEFRKEFGKSYL